MCVIKNKWEENVMLNFLEIISEDFFREKRGGKRGEGKSKKDRKGIIKGKFL